MAIAIRQARDDELEALIPILLLAEQSERALRWGLANLVDAVYRMDDNEHLVGAATMKWRSDPCEIMELGIAPDFQRQGLGKEFVAWLIQEARQRGKKQTLVGTSNSSLGNIAFYQKCGFRMDSVRHDYFWYLPQPSYENSIQIQDLLVFRFDLVPSSTKKKKQTPRGKAN
ncbi:GNAT family N-acetyltransferase [Nostoc sp. ChiSLP03a]|uniref:GNAT family N-acetyltransferase n=1 Tax=Nostoc sp. ChiSLP03a TaxID=3075380 RepID=UPI002AD4C118|nr:GNAT family N-acetyltransferase [Nostoc sp. ChiSLP03a]MDZ8212556.1 GNAT family N-acetyltransferase [Nostoc sp. ChiSLP03a]